MVSGENRFNSETGCKVVTSKDLLVLLPSLAQGGVEISTINLLQGLTDAGVSTALTVVRSNGELWDLIPTDVEVICLNQPRLIRAIPSLVKVIRRIHPRAVLSNMVDLNLVATIACGLASAQPLILVEHIDPIARARAMEGVYERLFPLARRWLYRRADAVVAVSKGAAAGLVEGCGLPAKLVRSIPNALNLRRIQLLAAEEPPPQLNFSLNGDYIVSVGRLVPQKGHEDLIEAFGILRTRSEVHLVIVGDGYLRPKLEARVSDLGLRDAVLFTGFQPNPYAFMSRARVFVLPSRREGLSVAIIEAMACGVPVVATDCPSGPSEILYDGLFGILVPVGEPDRLAIEIEKLLCDPALGAELSKQGLTRAQDFNIPATTKRYLELFDEMGLNFGGR